MCSNQKEGVPNITQSKLSGVPTISGSFGTQTEYVFLSGGVFLSTFYQFFYVFWKTIYLYTDEVDMGMITPYC